MARCNFPGCMDKAVTEWEGMPLCGEHYYEYKAKYPSEFEVLLQRAKGDKNEPAAIWH